MLFSAAILICLLAPSAGAQEFAIDYSQVTYVTRNVEKGELVGMSMPLVTDNSRHFEAFVGIPYAQPPVGDLRWRRPEEVNQWDGQYNATYYRPACPQPLGPIRDWSLGPNYDNTDEDCLYLNVFRVRDERSADLQPVMVFIHGGSFRYGSGEEYDSRILAQQGVVVVTINYRLGALGFLSTDDDEAPGNFGLLDMVESLRWVNANIANFGGDSTSVTVFGNSAGGAAVSLLVFSKLTQDLMHRVIPQSGAALSGWAVYRPPDANLPRAQDLAKAFDCPTEPSTALLSCMRQQDATQIVLTSVSGSSFNSAWAPRIDGYFLEKLPEELLASGDFNYIDLLTGTVPDETSDEYSGVGFNRTEKERRMRVWSTRYNDKADVTYNALLHEYNWPGEDEDKNRDMVIEYRSDFEYIAPHNRLANGHAVYHGNTRLYSFQYRSANKNVPEWMGVPHFEECLYIYGTPFWSDDKYCPWGCLNEVWHTSQQWNAEDELMSRRIMATWTNFAKTGDPTVPQQVPGLPASWALFNSTTEHYMPLAGGPKMWKESNFYKFPRMDFWNVYFSGLLN